jgi:hypothetical protein
MLPQVDDVLTPCVDINLGEDSEFCPSAQAILDRLNVHSKLSPSQRCMHSLSAIRRLDLRAFEARLAGSYP